jgi:hypothetical protein
MDKASQEIDSALGMGGTRHSPVIGAWSDGAENSTMAEINQPSSMEALRLSAAMKGSLAHQKAVLVFQTDMDGKDRLYSMAAVGTPEQMHADLLKSGIPFHTLATYGPGKNSNLTRIVVVDTDGSLHDKISTFAETHHTAAMGFAGHAEFIGDQEGTGSDAEQRQRAQKAYDSIIAGAQGRYPNGDGRAVWQGIRDRWANRLEAIKRWARASFDKHLGDAQSWKFKR